MNTYHAHLAPWLSGGALVVTVSQNARDMLRDAWPHPERYRLQVLGADLAATPPPPPETTTTTTATTTTTTTTSSTTTTTTGRPAPPIDDPGDHDDEARRRPRPWRVDQVGSRSIEARCRPVGFEHGQGDPVEAGDAALAGRTSRTSIEGAAARRPSGALDRLAVLDDHRAARRRRRRPMRRDQPA